MNKICICFSGTSIDFKALLFGLPILIGLPSPVFSAEVGVETSTGDFSQPLSSGFYEASGVSGDVPDTSHPWTHLINARHSNASNNYQLQLGSTYAINNRLFFRKIAVTPAVGQNNAWYEVATRTDNTFTGIQTFNADLKVNRVGSPVFPNNLSDDSQSLYTYVDDWAAWFVSEQDENVGGNGSFSFVMDDDGTANPRFQLVTKSNLFNYILFARADGNVGIGTGSPDHKLDVNGTMRAKEVIVESNWSDFVFEDDYYLRSLDEVEKHISEFGHLPDVPSAKEIQENGLGVSEAHTVMMQKIEELTLYMIDLKNENDELTRDNLAITQKLHELEKSILEMK